MLEGQEAKDISGRGYVGSPPDFQVVDEAKENRPPRKSFHARIGGMTHDYFAFARNWGWLAQLTPSLIPGSLVLDLL